MKTTKQTEKWAGEFGKAYTDRSTLTVDAYETYTKGKSGFTQTELIREFLSDLPISSVLEVGTNVGLQLMMLEKNGFRNLYGIEIQEYAANKAKLVTQGKDIYIVKGSALDIPYKDRLFDLVFTGGVLIHISPNDLGTVMDEMYRCSRRYIWGHEYYSESSENINYRGETDLLWKKDFGKAFVDRFPGLKLLKQRIYMENNDPNKKYSMYLLEKPV